jgi:hypothetical protein
MGPETLNLRLRAMMTRNSLRRRATGTLAAFGLLGTLGACDSLLSVENPGAIQEESLNDATVVPLLVNSAVGEFQAMHTALAYYGAVFSDEAVTGHNFETIQQIDLRIMDPSNGTLTYSIYQPLHAARFAADSASSRLRKLLPNATQDVRLARTLAYAGYTHTLLGEHFCESPVNGSAAKSSQELLRTGLQRFEEAIQVAKAAGAKASTDSLLNLARVGGARAALQLGDRAKAIQLASQVPAGFEMRVAHSDNSARQYNPFHGHTTGSNHNLGVDPRFLNLKDPRVRHAAKGVLGHNRSTILFKPFQPASFEGWSPAAAAGFERSTDVRFASGLEARYVVAEAEGPTPATLEFVNARRAVGGQAPLAATATPAQIMAELREQRARDFYMDGHRVGDLRRYLAQGIKDARHSFPSGAHPNPLMGEYQGATCFVIPLAEKIGNPNL